MIVLTGKCRICRSRHGQAITLAMVSGVMYRDIIAQYSTVSMTKQMLSAHKRHYVDPAIAEQGIEEYDSDHKAIDLLRELGVSYLAKAKMGEALTLSQTRIITAMIQGIIGRKQIEDSQEQLKAFTDLVENASKARWKHENE